MGESTEREVAYIFHDGAVWVECSSATDNEGCGASGVLLWHRMVEPDVITTGVVLCVCVCVRVCVRVCVHVCVRERERERGRETEK